MAFREPISWGLAKDNNLCGGQICQLVFISLFLHEVWILNDKVRSSFFILVFICISLVYRELSMYLSVYLVYQDLLSISKSIYLVYRDLSIDLSIYVFTSYVEIYQCICLSSILRAIYLSIDLSSMSSSIYVSKYLSSILRSIYLVYLLGISIYLSVIIWLHTLMCLMRT